MAAINLTGTEKQVAWATEILESYLAKWESWAEFERGNGYEDAAEDLTKFREILATKEIPADLVIGLRENADPELNAVLSNTIVRKYGK